MDTAQRLVRARRLRRFVTVGRLAWNGAAWFFALQFAMLNPILAVTLASLGATGPQIGAAYAVYNGTGFLATLVIPVVADRRDDYLRPLLACAICGLAFTIVLASTTSLVVAAGALVVLGAPTGVGASLLFAQLRRDGVGSAQLMRTRAVVSSAWVVGPPLSTVVAAAFSDRVILIVIAAISAVTVIAAVVLRVHAAGARADVAREPVPGLRAVRDLPARTWASLLPFFLLLMFNNAAITTVGLLVTRDLRVSIAWAGIAMGVSAGAEIPFLLVAGRLLARHSPWTLMACACTAGALYYGLVAATANPIVLVAAQPLNAFFFATITAVGLTVYQSVIPGPGFATGLFANTQRIAATVAGGLISASFALPEGYRALYGICAIGALGVGGALVVVTRLTRSGRSTPARSTA